MLNKDKVVEIGKIGVLNSNVGFVALWNYVMNANLDVGAVTVIHMIFADLIVKMQQLGGVAVDDPKYKEVMKYVNAIFDVAFSAGKREGEYVSPFGSPVTEDSNVTVLSVTDSKIAAVDAAVRTMTITPANVLLASKDLIGAGRFYQERTIDASKTCDDIFIPYAVNLRRALKLMSRLQDNFNIRINWDRADIEDNKVVTLENGHKAINGCEYNVIDKPTFTQSDMRGNKRIIVRDFMHEIRLNTAASIVELAAELAGKKQSFSAATIDWVQSIGTDPQYKEAVDIVRLMKEEYMSLTAAQTDQIRGAATFPLNVREEYVKAIKTEIKRGYAAIGNTLRLALDGFSDTKKTAVALYVIFSEKGKDTMKASDSELSSFAHTILETEFFKFVMLCLKNDDRVPKYTEDRLEENSFDSGDIVTFVFGEARNEDNSKIAIAEDDLEGEFEIFYKEDEDCFVARKEIQSLVKTPDVAPNQICFMTKAVSNLNGVISKMGEGNEVVLIPHGKAANGYEYHDSVVVDGEVVASFRCGVDFNAKNRAQSGGITKFYNRKKGKVTFSMPCKTVDRFGRQGNSVFVVLDGIEDITEVPDAKLPAPKAPVVRKGSRPKVTLGNKREGAAKAVSSRPQVKIKAAPSVVEKIMAKVDAKPKAVKTKTGRPAAPEPSKTAVDPLQAAFRKFARALVAESLEEATVPEEQLFMEYMAALNSFKGCGLNFKQLKDITAKYIHRVAGDACPEEYADYVRQYIAG